MFVDAKEELFAEEILTLVDVGLSFGHRLGEQFFHLVVTDVLRGPLRCHVCGEVFGELHRWRKDTEIRGERSRDKHQLESEKQDIQSFL